MAGRAGHSDCQEDYDDDEEANNNNGKTTRHNKSMFRVGHETYVVQIPREQIYRVPPPENTEFVKRYGNPVKDKGPGDGTRRRCAYWLFSIIFALAFMITVIVCVNKFTVTPNPPTFSINHLLLVNQSSSSSSSSSKKNVFLVTVKTRNPNIVNEIGYKEGKTSLTYKGNQIGKGPFPALENQPPAHSDALNVTLLASSDSDSDFNAAAAKSVIMNLSINIPINLKTWLWTTTLNFLVNCDFQADAIGPRFQIQSQTCHVIHNQQP